MGQMALDWRGLMQGQYLAATDSIQAKMFAYPIN